MFFNVWQYNVFMKNKIRYENSCVWLAAQKSYINSKDVRKKLEIAIVNGQAANNELTGNLVSELKLEVAAGLGMLRSLIGSGRQFIRI